MFNLGLYFLTPRSNKDKGPKSFGILFNSVKNSWKIKFWKKVVEGYTLICIFQINYKSKISKKSLTRIVLSIVNYTASLAVLNFCSQIDNLLTAIAIINLDLRNRLKLSSS